MIERLAQCHYLKEMRPSGDPEGCTLGYSSTSSMSALVISYIVQRPRHVCFTPNSGRALAAQEFAMCHKRTSIMRCWSANKRKTGAIRSSSGFWFAVRASTVSSSFLPCILQ